MRILYLSCHEPLAYDEASLFAELGHEVFIIGDKPGLLRPCIERQTNARCAFLSDEQKKSVLQHVHQYMTQKSMRAETFERFALQGTPSCILFDRKGELKDVSFGQIDYKQAMVEHFLAEKV